MSKAKPVIIKRNRIVKDNLKFLSCMSNVTQEDVIYKATANDFLQGKYPNLVLINKLNRLNNSSQTIARFSSMNSSVIELTSDAVTRLIGQRNYDLVFAALCSVISQELRIQGILALLTQKQFITDNLCKAPKLEKSDASTQTDQSCMSILMQEKRRKNRRCHAKPYVVKDKADKVVTKVVIHPKTLKCDVNTKKDVIKCHAKPYVVKYKTDKVAATNVVIYPKTLKCDVNTIKDEIKVKTPETDFPETKLFVDEDSNISNASTSNISISSSNIPMTVLENPEFILNNVDKYTEETVPMFHTNLTVGDGSMVNMNTKVEDSFHLVREDILNDMSKEDQQKLILQQAIIDFKFCVERDEDGNLPIHQAVIQKDASFVKRQCIMLNKRGESIDELSGINLTALQMSVFHDALDCTEVLLRYGADVLALDDEGRTVFHLVATLESDYLKILIEHCKKNARSILMQNDELCNANWYERSEEDAADFLLFSISVMCDSQGYTPLMLASKLGIAKNVKLLIDISPNTINKTMPNCGNTALYLAVGAACLDADDRGDRSQVADNYLKTVELLIVNGADPYLNNNSGSNVNDLLSEFNIRSLSLLIANKLTSVKFFNGDTIKSFENYMLIKNSDGKVGIAEMNRETQKENDSLKTGGSKIILYPKDIMNNEVAVGSVKKEEASTQTPFVIVKNKKGDKNVVVSQVNNKNKDTDVVSDKPKILQNIPIVSKVSSTGLVREKRDTIFVSKKPKSILKPQPIHEKLVEIKETHANKNIATTLNLSNTDQVKYVKVVQKEKSMLSGLKRSSDVNIGASCSKKRK